MPKYKVPQSDAYRRNFMQKTLATATIDSAKGDAYLDVAFITELTTFFDVYNPAYQAAQAALGSRVIETAQSKQAAIDLELYVRHIWTAVYNRAQRQHLDVGVLQFYKLNSNGNRPYPTSRLEWIGMAVDLIKGDADAVAAGFAPAAEPSALELQAILDHANAEAGDVISADRDYDKAQAAVAALRLRADELLREIRDVILFATRHMDAPSQRRILRSYGAQYAYLPGESLDEDDETAVVTE